jgi:hypothetical protein
MPRRVTSHRRPTVRERLARFVRALFSSDRPSQENEWPDQPPGGIGVREPRRPLRPTTSGGVALEIPPEEKTDVRAIGEERD